MGQQLIVVTGATGNIGKKTAESLLSKGLKVRAVGRNEKNLESLAKMGAEIFVGDVQDVNTVKKAFAGAAAVFTLIPPNYASENARAYQNRVADNYAQAIESNKVQYVVNLSSVGAHLSSGNGMIAGLYDAEQRFNKLAGVNIVHLRPAFFLENHFFTIGLVKERGINGSALNGNVAIPQIATKDIAAVAADLLSKLDFTGASVRELLGSRDVSMIEANRILGKAIGKPELPFIQFSYDDVSKSMAGMGATADVARMFVEMYQGFNSGTIKPTEPRSSKNTTPTSIEEFAGVYAQVYGN